MSLPSFTIDATTHLYDITGGAIGTTLTAQALTSTRVVFKCNVPQDAFIVYQGDMYRGPSKVYADVSEEGTILADGFPVRLLANDPGLTVENIQWTIQVLAPIAGGLQEMVPWTIDAPLAGVVVDLAETTPVPSVDPVGVVRGPKGDPVDDVKLIGGSLVFYVDGAPIGNPIDFVSVIGQTYTQASAAATWIIPNTLGRKARAIDVFIGNELVDADVTLPNDSTSPITVTFATPQSGRAEIT